MLGGRRGRARARPRARGRAGQPPAARLGHAARAREPAPVARPAQAAVLGRVPDQPALRRRHPGRHRLQRARRGPAARARRRSRGPDVRRRLLGGAVASAVLLARPGCTPEQCDDDARRRRAARATSPATAARRPGPRATAPARSSCRGTDFAGTAQDVADWRGDVVVLNTWYANCPPCRAEAPDLAALSDRLRRRRRAGAGHQPDRRRRHRAGLRAPVRGARTRASRTPTAPRSPRCRASSRCNAVPTTIVLDREGMVAGRILGLADPSTLRSMVDERRWPRPARRPRRLLADAGDAFGQTRHLRVAAAGGPGGAARRARVVRVAVRAAARARRTSGTSAG